MLAFLLSKEGLKIIGTIAVVLLFGFIEYEVYHTGFKHGVLTETVKYDKLIQEINDKTNTEIERQDHAASVLGTFQEGLIADLKSKNEELDKIIKENKSEAANDKDRDSDGLGASSVMRINRVR